MEPHKHFYDPPVILGGDLPKLREHLLADGPDADLYLHIGHFMTWFAATEYLLSIMLRRLTGVADPSMFKMLSHGMDAKVKVNRIVEASAISTPIGPELKLRLNHFLNCHVPLRNKLVHSFMTWIAEPVAGVQMSQADSPPTQGKPARQGFREPEFLEADRLFEYSIWLKAFTMDLSDMAKAARPGVFERDEYRASLPKGHPKGPQKPTPTANPHKPARTPRSRPQ